MRFAFMATQRIVRLESIAARHLRGEAASSGGAGGENKVHNENVKSS